jgi:hypothetical protein
MSRRNRSGMIGKNIPKLLLKAIGNDPKRLQKVLDKFKEIRRQPKLPGLKKGTGENGVVYKDKKGKVISKGEAMKAFDKADAAERRDKGKLPKSKPKVGGRMSDIFKSYGKAPKGVMTLSSGSPKTFAEMQPYGGKYAKKKKEMTATAAQNVKRLMTQPDAYDPETRYIQGFQKKGNKIRVASKKTTDATNLKAEAAKMKADLGAGSRVGIFETPMRVGSRGFEPIRYTPRNRKKGKRVQMPVRPEPVRPMNKPLHKRPKKKFKNGGESTIKTVAAKLKKASKAHAGQAKALEKVVKKKGGGLMDYYKDIL